MNDFKLSPADEEELAEYLSHSWNKDTGRCDKCNSIMTDENEGEICTNPQ